MCTSQNIHIAVGVMQSESRDGEKIVNLGDCVRSDKLVRVGMCPAPSAANFVFCHTFSAYIPLKARYDKIKSIKKNQIVKKFRMHLDAIRNVSQNKQNIRARVHKASILADPVIWPGTGDGARWNWRRGQDARHRPRGRPLSG